MTFPRACATRSRHSWTCRGSSRSLAGTPPAIGSGRWPVGPSRHLVRFLDSDGTAYALKEQPAVVAEREFTVLRHLEEAGLPAVRPSAWRRRPERGDGILVTPYLRSLDAVQSPAHARAGRSSTYRDRLLDAMALLVDLHRGGVYWGDCSLANTLFRRDGDRIQAYLVDAETSEVHPGLSDGTAPADLDILVENVAFGLADLAAYQGRPEHGDAAIEAAESVRERYEAVGTLHGEPDLNPGDRRAIRARMRRLNDLGFSVRPGGGSHRRRGTVRLRTLVTTRRYHANEVERRTRCAP